MLANQVAVKILTRHSIAQEPLIAVFHAWIREGRLREHVLIDVADYRHVPSGPGVMLIAHEAHIALDEGEPGPGLHYARKRDPLGDFDGKFREALAWAAHSADMLERDLGTSGLFDPNHLVVEIRSRLATPDTIEAGRALSAACRGVAVSAWGDDVSIATRGDGRRVAAVVIDAREAVRAMATVADLATTVAPPVQQRRLQVLA